jgi:hypothetical protein
MDTLRLRGYGSEIFDLKSEISDFRSRLPVTPALSPEYGGEGD